jgi:hypothetical protein
MLRLESTFQCYCPTVLKYLAFVCLKSALSSGQWSASKAPPQPSGWGVPTTAYQPVYLSIHDLGSEFLNLMFSGTQNPGQDTERPLFLQPTHCTGGCQSGWQNYAQKECLFSTTCQQARGWQGGHGCWS